jgi:hypothetical protein
LILRRRQSKDRPDRLGVSEAGWHIDGGALGQRHHRADPGNRHQAPAHLIIPDDGQQAAVEDADLLAKSPPDNEEWFDQKDQIGDTLDQLRATGLGLLSLMSMMIPRCSGMFSCLEDLSLCWKLQPIPEDIIGKI